jgi:parvulin-like peptidyl-prolyl isomerase
MRHPLLATCFVLPAALAAQDSTASQPSSAPAAQSPDVAWPRDKDRVVAKVDGRELTLGDLMRHLDERHAPKLLALLDGGHFDATLRSASLAQWVRQYADATALAAEARWKKLDPKACEQALSEALKAGFSKYLKLYSDRLPKGESLSQAEVNHLLDRYQRDCGLQAEVAGWLDALVRATFTEQETFQFYNDHVRELGGRVTFAHILIHHRDPVTGVLLAGEARSKALARVADVRARLKPDGSNFEEVAALLSDDKKTARRGGVFEQVGRYDSRLPAELCRATWRLRDGEWSGPVETAFGLHFVKRISFAQVEFALYSPSLRPLVEQTMRQHLQEDLLFAVREKRGVELLY